MKKIIDYGLVEGSNYLDLNNVVVANIANGWQPFGSPFSVVIGEYGDDVKYYQAIVKYKEDENDE